jgi:hypothetical protein
MMELTTGNVGDHTGYVLDNALSSCYMSKLQNLRTSLPIDKEKKKTAAARRFLCAENDFEWIRVGLVAAIRQGLLETNEDSLFNGCDDDEIIVRVLPWMRFLEYTTPNGSLGPHTDALIRCKETDVWSTHTLLVFCSDCKVGGETTLLPEDAKTTRLRKKKVQKAMDAAGEVTAAMARINTSCDGQQISADDAVSNEEKSTRLDRLQTTLQTIEENIATMNEEADKQCFPVKPKCGRILFFPHECPHEGRPTVSVPKIFLRAELILKRKR